MKLAMRWTGIVLAAAFALSLGIPSVRNAYAAAVDATVQKVGVTLTTDPSGSSMVQMVGMTDSVRAQFLNAGTSSGTAQGAANSSSAALLTVQASQIGINSSPAVNTQASASVAAGGATVRHMAAHCSGSIATVAAQTQVNLNLRDGATGAGTILWAGTILCPISTQCALDSGPINIIGTAATAMTCEWNGVPAVGNFEVANLEYKNAG